MKSSVYKAVSEFEKRLKEAMPEALIDVIDPLEGEDGSLEVLLEEVSWETMRQIAGIQIDVEEKYDVSLSFVPKTNNNQQGV